MKIELICKNCNNSFITEYKHRDKKFCNLTCYIDYAKKNKLFGREKDDSTREERICLECGVTFIERKKYDRKLCSDNCRNLWNAREENKNLKKEKTQEALLKKYGVKTMFDLQSFKDSKKNIFIEKYGVDSPMKVPEFVNKLKKTILHKHLKTLIKKLNEHDLILLDEYSVNKNGNTSKSYNFKCLKCDNIFSSTVLGCGKIPICRKCKPIVKNSALEQEIKDFLNKNNIKHIDNNRSLLNGLEIDIFIPDFNLGIEINGNYYHSDINGMKDKKYHLNKTNIANSNNIKLIQIFEDEITNNLEIVLSRLAGYFNLNKKIYARNCLIKEVSSFESKNFLIKNHLQGNCVDKYRYGLYHNDELVSLITFGKKRKVLGNKDTENEYELLRFCNKLNYSVIGGFSKLLNFFLKNKTPHKIITYADIRWSGINPENTVYGKNKFNFIGLTPPNYWYLDVKKFTNRFHRFSFRKDVLVKEGFSKKKTEWEIMQERGYDRIWDCGSMKFELIP